MSEWSNFHRQVTFNYNGTVVSYKYSVSEECVEVECCATVLRIAFVDKAPSLRSIKLEVLEAIRDGRLPNPAQCDHYKVRKKDSLASGILASSVGSSPRGKRILVVDDDEPLLEQLQLCIEEEGYDVVTAVSGRDALEKMQDTKVDLILSDIRMPDGDGRFLLKRIRGRNCDVPFLLMTGYSGFEPLDAQRMGANAYFHKPLNVEHLIDAMDHELSARRSQGSFGIH